MTGARLRIRFAKHGKVRFTSHRDVARIWERALRRAGVPVAYSAGFSPRPKIAFGLALPTGYSSDAEYLDVEVDPVWLAGTDNETLVGTLTASLPAGMTALVAAGIASGGPSLQHAVTCCTWRIDAAGADATAASDAVARAMDGGELLAQRERKGRLTVDNIRPAVHAVEVQGNITDGVRLIAELATQPRAVRPAELLASLHPPLSVLRACRLHQWITTDAPERQEPLAVAGLGERQESLAVAGLSVAGAGVAL